MVALSVRQKRLIEMYQNHHLKYHHQARKKRTRFVHDLIKDVIYGGGEYFNTPS